MDGPGNTVFEGYQMAQVADYRALLSGTSWYRSELVGRPVFLTYSFEQSTPTYFAAQNPNVASSFQAFSEAERAVVRSALDAWASVSGIRFMETVHHQGDLTFAFYDLNRLSFPVTSDTAALGYYPTSFAYQYDGVTQGRVDESLIAGDVLFSSSYRQSSYFADDLKYLALHEIGHALGLKHPFEGSETLVPALDNGNNTVMSYNDPRAHQLGQLDIAAVQHLYGGPNADGTQVASWSWDQTHERLTQVGTTAAELIRGTGADDVIRSMGGADIIYTAQGRDYVVLVGQAARVHGGEDIDTVDTGVTTYNPAAFRSGSNWHQLELGGGAVQTFHDVERFVFGSEVIAFDTNGAAGQIYRLYQAAFDRAPDTPGISFNLANYENYGFTLKEMANFFVVSPEFSRLYGANSNNTTFIEAMYANVLNRAPDADGMQYYQTRLASHVWDRADVLAGFSQSPENIALVAPQVQNGIHLDNQVLWA